MGRGFAEGEFVPFETDGDSHLDFVIHRETAEFHNSPRLSNLWTKIYDYFLGPPAVTVRPAGELKEDETVAEKKPSEYISSLDKVIYLDMHLDIQVSAVTGNRL